MLANSVLSSQRTISSSVTTYLDVSVISVLSGPMVSSGHLCFFPRYELIAICVLCPGVSDVFLVSQISFCGGCLNNGAAEFCRLCLFWLIGHADKSTLPQP